MTITWTTPQEVPQATPILTSELRLTLAHVTIYLLDKWAENKTLENIQAVNFWMKAWEGVQ